jgi:glycosyltransferase involved in cell wall biosynthesis
MMAPEFLPVWGGTGSYIVELIKRLPGNVDVHVVTLRRSIPGMDKNKLTDDVFDSVIGRPIQVHTISSSRETFFYNLAFQVACLKNIPKLHKEYKFDIMHSHLSHMPDVLLKLFSRVSIPTVATVHSTIRMQQDVTLANRSSFGELEWSERNTLLFFPIIEFLQKKYAKRVSRFIAVSDLTEKLIRKHLNVEKEKITVIHNGVDTRLFCPPTEAEKDERFSRPTVVFIGRIMAKKGLDVLIKSIPKILQSVPETRFLFVGSGNISFYREMLKKEGISRQNFSFIGHLGYFERPRILQQATVFVNPSFFENCSISILEAMSCNTAVIASEVGGNPEIIDSGRNGILVPPHRSGTLAESIVSLLRNESLNRAIGKEARRTVERSFSSQRCAQETYNVYKQVLGFSD